MLGTKENYEVAQCLQKLTNKRLFLWA